MQKEFITKNYQETKQLGALLAKELRGGEILCLSGELGAGKTTFSQGLLESLGAKGPYTSPTFLIMKEYVINNEKIKKVYHFDTYRITADDVLNLGWKEIIADKKNITIIEWADRIYDIIPKDALWINFKWTDEKERKIILT